MTYFRGYHIIETGEPIDFTKIANKIKANLEEIKKIQSQLTPKELEFFRSFIKHNPYIFEDSDAGLIVASFYDEATQETLDSVEEVIENWEYHLED